METKNIFNQDVSYFQHIRSINPGAKVSLIKLLTSHKHKKAIDEYRKTRSEAIKLSLPCYSPSGVFTKRKDKCLEEHSGLICVDIDYKDNTDVLNFENLKQLIIQIPYVAYCGLSCGGRGYFVLIPIKYEERHREHYTAICEDFQRCGISVDRSCINVSRLRFVSYDDTAYFNENAVVYSRMLESEEKSDNIEIKNYDLKTTQGRMEKLIGAIMSQKLDITRGYDRWRNIGAAIGCHYGEYGRGYFQSISRFHPKYDPVETSNQYSACLKLKNFSIGTLFYLAKESGIDLK